MITYLQKYNQLPKELRAKISTPEVLSAIAELEKKHNVGLASVVMRVMVRDIAFLDLVKYFVFEYNLDGLHAEELVGELKEKVFFGVAAYLGFNTDAYNKTEASGEDVDKWLKERANQAAVRSSNFFFSTEDEEEVKRLAKTVEEISIIEDNNNKVFAEQAEEIISKSRISLSSGDLINRLKQVIITYLRGTRNKIDARLTLTRRIDLGGLELDEKTADNIMSAALTVKIRELENKGALKAPAKIEVPEDGQGAEQEQLSAIGSEQAAAAGEQAPEAKSGTRTEEIKRSGIRDIDYDFGKLAASKKTAPGTMATLPALKKENITALAEPRILPPAINLKKDDKAPEKDQDNAPGKSEMRFEDETHEALDRSKEIAAEPKETVINLKFKDEAEIGASTAAQPKEENGAKEANETIDPASTTEGRIKPPAIPGIPAAPGTIKPEPIKPLAANTGIEIPKKENLAASAVKSEKILGKDTAPGTISIAEARQSFGTDANSVPAGKVRMDDIKYVPKTKLTGPIDELREMNPVDFRRLSDDPKASTKSINEKIKLLEEENYSQRLVGIKAWRESPIYRLYLEIGQESISRHKGIENIISEREKTGKEYLTNEEFKAIMDLNKDLRF